MKKRITALLLVVVMSCMLVMPTSALDITKALAAADSLNALGLFNGTGTDVYGKPLYDLSRSITRQEAIATLVRFLGKEDEALTEEWNIPFTDVDDSMKTYVGYAYENGIISSTPSTTFGANDNVTAAQFMTFVLRALGYSSDTDFKWDSPWTLAESLGLCGQGEYHLLNNNNFKRGDAAMILNNALSVANKTTGERMLDGAYANLLASESPAVKIDTLVSDICKARRNLYSSINDYDSIKKYAFTNDEDKTLVSKAELQALRANRNQRTVTYAEAVSDIDLYFRTFKAGYGAYYYFGDAKFKTIKANMLKDLEGKTTVTAGELDNIIKKHMVAIQDCHLKRGDVDEYEYLYCEGQSFYKDTKGYYKLIDEIKWYYDKCDSPYVKMVPTLTDTGALVYSLAWSSNGSNIVKRNKITLKNRGKTIEEVVEWKQATAYTKSGSIDYKYLKENGIAYISVRSFDNAHGASNYNDFRSSGYRVKDCDVIIMDLRANGGGTTSHPLQWVNNYLGYNAGTWQMTTAIRYSSVNGRAEYGQDTAKAGSGQVTMHKNDNLIIVLVDDKCGSAGEFAMQMMRTIDNCVVVGSPSKGCTFCCGSFASFCLPNSGVKYSYGTTMYWLDGKENRDDIGIELDIWCDPSEALDAVLLMLMREGKLDLDGMLSLQDQLK